MFFFQIYKTHIKPIKPKKNRPHKTRKTRRVGLYDKTRVLCQPWGRGGPNTPPPRKITKNAGFYSNTGPDPLKITKLRSQQSMLGHHRHSSETPYIWRFTLVYRHWPSDRGIWTLHPLKKRVKVGRPLINFLDPHMLIHVHDHFHVQHILVHFLKMIFVQLCGPFPYLVALRPYFVAFWPQRISLFRVD